MLQADSTLCIAKPQNSIGFNIKSLPKGGPNVGRVIPFVSHCPHKCNCGPNYWHHQICGSPLYINSFGDVFCQNFKTKKECKQIFIQKAKFQCNKASSSHQFQGPPHFLLAMAQCCERVEQNLGYKETMSFHIDLHQNGMKRWER